MNAALNQFYLTVFEAIFIKEIK